MPRATDKYKVNEIFYSIQGEGANTGQAAIFVRFSGCNLMCRFCDTDHKKYRLVSWTELMRKIEKISKQTGCKFVIFTGGEPLCQHVEVLSEELRKRKYRTGLETNGTYPLRSGMFDWVTVSPKRESDWSLPYDNFADYSCVVANEIKFVIDDKFKEDVLDEFFETYKGFLVYLQPMSRNAKCTAKAVELVKRRPDTCRLSLQTQKYGSFA